MLLTITDVEYLGDYSLLCSFNNGERRKVDLTPLLAYPAYADLRDKGNFIQFGLDHTIFGPTVPTLLQNISLNTVWRHKCSSKTS